MTRRKFTLDKQNGKFMGVCSGIANHFNIDATFVRVGLVVVTLLGAFPWTLIAYGVAVWMGKPARLGGHEAEASIATTRGSTYDLKNNMRDIDRRMAEVEHYVTSSNGSLATEIEQLR